MENKKIVRSPGTSMVILLGSFVFFLCIFSLLSGVIMPRIENQTTAMRIMTLFQSIFLFIVPALITAITATRLPARMLCIDRKLSLLPVGLIFIILLAAIPAMNYIIEWNNNMQLPQSMHAIEVQLRQMEDAAAAATGIIMGNDTVGSLIVAVLIVGVMAGLSEELFFRGAMQRVLGSMKMSKVLAVWITAIVFSFMHFQFYGFLPRFLLGLFFGYILVWGENLWYCVIAHAGNNIMAVVVNWCNMRADHVTGINLDTIGKQCDNTVSPLPVIIAGLLVVSIGLYLLKRELNKEREK